MGSSIGIAIFYPLFGFILSVTSWQWVFYLSGLFGSIWYLLWVGLVFDSPQKHPRIDKSELLYIEEALSGTLLHPTEKVSTKHRYLFFDLTLKNYFIFEIFNKSNNISFGPSS